MSALATGVDVIDLARFRAVLARHPERLLARCFTPGELRHCRGRVPELAVRFAAKEAVMKALGTGVRGIAWREIEVLPNRRGKPLVVLHGNAARRAERLGLTTLDVSLSHEKEYGVAMAVGLIAGLPPEESSPRAWLVTPAILQPDAPNGVQP